MKKGTVVSRAFLFRMFFGFFLRELQTDHTCFDQESVKTFHSFWGKCLFSVRLFFFRKFLVCCQCGMQFTFQVLSSLIQSISLSVNSRIFLYPALPASSFWFKSTYQFHILNFVALLSFVQSVQATSIIQKPLDEAIVYEVPTAWRAGNTTILFPSEISALYGKSIATQEQPNANFLISFVPGNYYVTLRALEKSAEDYLTIIFNHKAYILHLVASDEPFRTLTLFNPDKNRTRRTAINPSQLFSLLDKAKAYSLFQAQHPDALEGVLHSSPHIENPYQGFTVKIKNVWRFELQDTLIFGLEFVNPSNTTIRYKPQDLAVKLGERIYTQSIVDASGSMPPHTTTPAFFAVTGDGSGGRNHLSPDNNWSVLVIREPRDNKPAGGKL